MSDFKKTINTTGKIKDIIVHEGVLLYDETGEQCNFVEILSKLYGEDAPFTISTSQKVDEDLEI